MGSEETKYRKNDIVVFNSFAGVQIRARLVERIYYPKNDNWGGYGGWNAVLIYKKDMEKLKSHCVVVDKEEFWIYDWQIIKKTKSKRK